MRGHPFVKLYDEKRHVLVSAYNRRISHKDAWEISRNIKGMKVKDAIQLLEKVIKKKQPIRYRRYSEGAAHKTDIGPGRYPVNAAKEMINILNSLIKNAEYKGMNEDALYIKYISVTKGWSYYRPRRIRFRPQKRKSATIYVLGEERV